MPEYFAHFEEARIGYRDAIVFERLNLSLPKGCITALCGPNGCGKSTALRAMRGLLGLQGGLVRIGQTPLDQWPTRQLAKEIAMLTQSPSAPDEIRVIDLVRFGRFAHRKKIGGASDGDQVAVQLALASCDLDALADRPIGALSGGQLQRAWIAMVLAQDAPVVLLDEPTNHLDIAHALDVLELVRRLKKSQDKSFVLVLHDLNLAAKYADHLVLFKNGCVTAEGDVTKIFTRHTLSQVFDIDCRVFVDSQSGRPFCIPYPKETATLAETG